MLITYFRREMKVFKFFKNLESEENLFTDRWRWRWRLSESLNADFDTVAIFTCESSGLEH